VSKRLIGLHHLTEIGKIFFALLTLVVLPASAYAISDEQTAVDAIQKHYDATKTFKAGFTQKAYIKMMDQVQETRGEVYIKKPGKMKWIYNAPDPQILISNNKTLWLYLPEEKQVNKVPVENVYSNNTPALFLSGKGKLTDSFTVFQVIREEDKIVMVMTPKREDMGLEKLVLTADKNNYQIIGSTVYDKLGNKTDISFNKIEINLDLPEDMFQFKTPEGVEVMDFSAPPQHTR
jgi:outer membrane lipoprotein carrier protein